MRENWPISKGIQRRRKVRCGLQVRKQGLTVNAFISRRCFVKEIFGAPVLILRAPSLKYIRILQDGNLAIVTLTFHGVPVRVSLSLTANKWNTYQGVGISAVVLLGWFSYWLLELQNRKMRWRWRNIAKKVK